MQFYVYIFVKFASVMQHASRITLIRNERTSENL
jgi:hypothetical protein